MSRVKKVKLKTTRNTDRQVSVLVVGQYSSSSERHNEVDRGILTDDETVITITPFSSVDWLDSVEQSSSEPFRIVSTRTGLYLRRPLQALWLGQSR